MLYKLHKTEAESIKLKLSEEVFLLWRNFALFVDDLSTSWYYFCYLVSKWVSDVYLGEKVFRFEHVVDFSVWPFSRTDTGTWMYDGFFLEKENINEKMNQLINKYIKTFMQKLTF